MSGSVESKPERKTDERSHGQAGRRWRVPWRRVALGIVIWLVVFGLLFVMRQYTFSSAIVHDEGVFLYGGIAIASGEVPYRDFWDHKPPGISLFHSIPIGLFGYSLRAIRVHEVFWLAVSATIFFHLCRAHLSLGPAVLSVLLYSLFVSTKVLMRSGGLTEESALTFHVLAYLFALRGKGSLRLNFFLAGLFLGLAVQFRQPMGLTVVFVVLSLLWRPEGCKVSLREKAWVVPIIAVGALLPEAVSSGYFLLKGMWREYFEASYLFNFLYIGGGPDVLGLGAGLQKHWSILKSTGPYLASPFLVAPLLIWLPARQRRVAVLLVVAFFCDVVGITLGGRYYEHYYLQATVSSCFLLGILFQAAYERQRNVFFQRRKGFFRASLFFPAHWHGLVVVGLCVVLTTVGVKKYVKTYKMGLEERSRPDGERTVQDGIGKAIRIVTEPEERVLLLGASPTAVYFTGQRLAGSRYYHLSPFFRGCFADAIRKRPAYRRRFLEDMQTRRPVLVILAREERQIYFAGMEVVEKSAAAEFLVPYLEENYVALETFYRRPWRKEGWSWYRRTCTFLIRKDKADEVKARLERADKAAP